MLTAEVKQNYSNGITFSPMEATISAHSQVVMNDIGMTEFLLAEDGLSAQLNAEQDLATAWIFGLMD